jgi:hypothetical protein
VLSHNGPNSVNPPTYAPAELFDRLFPGAGAAAAPSPATTRAAALLATGRKSILDASLADLADLRRRVGPRDRARLDEHVEGLRALEKRIKAATVSPAATGCAGVSRPAATGTTRTGLGHREVNRAMADLLALALACDISRVFSFRFAMWHTSRFPDIGGNNDLHTYTHDEPGDQPMVARHVLFTMGELAYLLEKLDATAVGAGTLLDHAAILCTSEVQEGRSHSTRNMPIVVAGSAGGALRTGFHHRGANENTSKVHLTLLKACGVPATSFGAEAGLATDTVGALVA